MGNTLSANFVERTSTPTVPSEMSQLEQTVNEIALEGVGIQLVLKQLGEWVDQGDLIADGPLLVHGISRFTYPDW